ncbi:MAG TPA: DNA polymerase I [Actinomycetota bacterium]|nr:DNA polymerase I [Actinomycetota bacterium]
MARKLVYIDGHSLAYRAFFALPTSLVTSTGQITNAVYGFTAMLIKLLGDERPDGVVVCFDKGKPAYRYDRYAEYKAGRAATPDEFRDQLGLLREVLEVLRLPVLELEGYEADDLLATLARRTVEAGDEAVILTGDRDVLQLVRPGVTALMTGRGVTDMKRYDRDAVFDRYGIYPEQWQDFAALKGETSDNLPGVPGVGDKTAAKLVNQFGDVEGVIANADSLTPKVRAGVVEMADQIRLNKELNRLLDDVEIDIDLGSIRLEPFDDEGVRKCFTSLEFPTLYARLREIDATATTEAPSLELERVEQLMDVELPDELAIASDASWLAVAMGERSAGVVPMEAAPGMLRDELADPSRPKVAHDAKALIRMVLEAGGDLHGLELDTHVAAYLLDPGAAGGYRLPDVVRRVLGVSIDEEPEEGKPKQATLELVSDDGERAALEAVAVRALAPVLREQLTNRGMWELATTLEFPLVRVLARMERAGIAIDIDYLKQLNGELGARMSELEARIHTHAGYEFNVNSNPQLQKILFEDLGLPKTKRIKTGYSTDQAELAKLAGAHPMVDDLIAYREVAKLKTGFTDSLLPLVNPKTGRIHTTYVQTGAATGRLSSTAPNVQNIPIRGDLGRQIRRAFTAPPGKVLLSADYSQIELRVLAHLSQDPGILEAFRGHHDFHAAIAAKVYGVPVSDVTPQMRSYAKQFSYGIAYGMGAFGVSQRLQVEMEDARDFVDAYYAQFPQIKDFLDAQVGRAKVDGFTTTLFGRRRYLPELNSPNPRIRGMGERMALNAPIQGTAADIIKRAMIDVDAALEASPEVATMLLSVHDELVFEVPEGMQESATELVRTHMEAAADLICGLEVDVHVGANWDAAHA